MTTLVEIYFTFFLLHSSLLKSREHRWVSHLRNTLYPTSYQCATSKSDLRLGSTINCSLFSHVWGNKFALKRFNVKNTNTYTMKIYRSWLRGILWSNYAIPKVARGVSGSYSPMRQMVWHYNLLNYFLTVYRMVL